VQKPAINQLPLGPSNLYSNAFVLVGHVISATLKSSYSQIFISPIVLLATLTVLLKRNLENFLSFSARGLTAQALILDLAFFTAVMSSPACIFTGI
jgi:hypothetical protein